MPFRKGVGSNPTAVRKGVGSNPTAALQAALSSRWARWWVLRSASRPFRWARVVGAAQRLSTIVCGGCWEGMALSVICVLR